MKSIKFISCRKICLFEKKKLSISVSLQYRRIFLCPENINVLKFVDMKKFIAFIGAMVAGLLVFQSCEEHKISPDKLPEAAQTFISQFFPGTTVTFAEKEKDDGVVKYNVRLSDGTEIDFDKDGVWTSVDCEFSVLPDGILPAPISEYITANYPQAKAYKVDKELGGYEVTITGGLELLFNSAGEFIRESR